MENGSAKNGVFLETVRQDCTLSGFYVGLLMGAQQKFCNNCIAGALRKLIRDDQSESLEDLLEGVIAELSNPRTNQPLRAASESRRIVTESDSCKRIVPIEKIRYISANGNSVNIHLEGETVELGQSMKTMEAHLPPDEFYRNHRSYIIQLDQVEALIHDSPGRFQVRLMDGTLLPVSRPRYASLEERLCLLQ